MSAYIIRRLLILPFIVFAVTLMIFAMMSQVSPTQRAALYVSDIPKTKDGLQKIIEKYGLDDPIPVQYFRWVKQIATGDLGYSKTGKESVMEVIQHRFPATLELALFASALIILLGVRLGIVAALRHNKWPDQTLRLFSIVGTSVPTFVIGLVLLMVFAAVLQWLPAGDRLSVQSQGLVDGPTWHGYTQLYTIDSLLNGNVNVFVDAVRHLLLPVLTLAIISVAVLMRVTRSSMLDTLRQDYVRTARAKGLTEHVVIQKHARPNAMLPVVTLAGLTVAGLLSGAVITETVFNWPGIGQKTVQAATNLDLVTVLGLTMFFAVILIIANLVVDILYALIDPRVRLS
jgi:peptide/nickel transport system permease protein